MRDVAADLRPLGIGDIFDASLRLYRRLFRVLIAIMAVSYGVVLPALSAAVERFVQPAYRLQEADLAAFWRALTAERSRVLPLAAIFLVNLVLVRPLVEGAVVAAAGRGYVEDAAGFGGAYATALKRLGALVGALTLQILIYTGVIAVAAAAGAALALVSPWLALLAIPLALAGLALLGLQFSFVAEAVVLDGAAPMAALARSRRLAKRNYGRITLVYLLGLTATLVLAKLCGTLASLAAPGSPFVSTLAEMLATIVGLPLSWASFVVLYYDLRVRKEGYDLERLADRVLGDEPAAAA
ncbi:MAG TPA: hypothetical protein VGQ83_24695 [Polyangia bacterium]